MRENLLAQLGNFDLFWCGPKDEWYERTAAFLHGIPEYRREIAYETVPWQLAPYTTQGTDGYLMYCRVNDALRAMASQQSRCPNRRSRNVFKLQAVQQTHAMGLVLQEEERGGFRYDHIMRTRPDALFTGVASDRRGQRSHLQPGRWLVGLANYTGVFRGAQGTEVDGLLAGSSDLVIKFLTHQQEGSSYFELYSKELKSGTPFLQIAAGQLEDGLLLSEEQTRILTNLKLTFQSCMQEQEQRDSDSSSRRVVISRPNLISRSATCRLALAISLNGANKTGNRRLPSARAKVSSRWSRIPAHEG
jgi:hypothetical protein